MTESPELKALVDAVEVLLDSTEWYPADEYGTPEMLVLSASVARLQTAYEHYLNNYVETNPQGFSQTGIVTAILHELDRQSPNGCATPEMYRVIAEVSTRIADAANTGVTPPVASAPPVSGVARCADAGGDASGAERRD